MHFFFFHADKSPLLLFYRTDALRLRGAVKGFPSSRGLSLASLKPNLASIVGATSARSPRRVTLGSLVPKKT